MAADGGVYPNSFEQEKLFDPRIRTLLGKIEVVANDEIDAMFPGHQAGHRHASTTNDGREFTETVDHAKGSPQNPLSDDELIAKFRANCRRRDRHRASGRDHRGHLGLRRAAPTWGTT